jgi:hypothetical protein
MLPADRILAALMREHTLEALNALVSIGRGDVEAARAYLSGQRPGHDAAARRRQRQRRRIARKQPIEPSEVEQQSEPEQIPWSVRLRAWIEVLNRGCGKPFQSVEIFDEHDAPVRFDEDPDELRQKLIERGVPASLLPPPSDSALSIDADAIRAEVERDNEELRRQRTSGRT